MTTLFYICLSLALVLSANAQDFDDDRFGEGRSQSEFGEQGNGGHSENGFQDGVHSDRNSKNEGFSSGSFGSQGGSKTEGHSAGGNSVGGHGKQSAQAG